MSQGVPQCFLLYGSWHKEAAPTSAVSLERCSWWTCSAWSFFRPFLGLYHQAMVEKVHQGTWRIKNQLHGHSSMYIHCVWKEDKEQKMEWSSPSCFSSAKDPGPRGLFSAAPLVPCKAGPSSGSSSFTQAWRGKKNEDRASVWSTY